MTRKCKYDPTPNLVDIQGDFGTTRKYLPVDQRVLWFLTYCQEKGIEPKILETEANLLVGNLGVATCRIYMDGEDVGASKAGFVVTGDPAVDQSVVQRAFTSAKGRALANLGFGSGFMAPSEDGSSASDPLICDAGAPAPAAELPKTEAPGPDAAPKAEAPAMQKAEAPAMPKPALPTSAAPAPKPAAPVQPQAGMTLEEARNFVIPGGEKKGKTLAELMGEDPGFVRFYASRETPRHRALSQAARLVLEAAGEG